ncbi:hypothetical protein M0E82_01855 [Corynebacterium sp. P7202]|uniref:Uncharacterized protein n=1 Tax=Corynebacterium pygosceleis TaxID=2800406 RepID=A0A9Q4C729_9CORY|nr:hypothetical protein [Corynebacterium pygosceleis]MCK7636752.1 hypothetical protein [Corynebacterium pygosceleis]MCX7467506.1 hypothetical protein [Corynebacterium pygosceleis]
MIEHTIALADALQAALTNPGNTTASDPTDVDYIGDDDPPGGSPQLRAI